MQTHQVNFPRIFHVSSTFHDESVGIIDGLTRSVKNDEGESPSETSAPVEDQGTEQGEPYNHVHGRTPTAGGIDLLDVVSQCRNSKDLEKGYHLTDKSQKIYVFARRA